MSKITLENKRVLIVDDEPDVLSFLEELLSMCRISRAQSFKQANDLLNEHEFDIAILDIMGVSGYELLDIASQKDIICVMLTARAFTPEDIKKSYHGGACSYIPKEEITQIEDFLFDVLAARQKGENPWVSWYERLAAFCEEKFGPDWIQEERKFWEKMMYY